MSVFNENSDCVKCHGQVKEDIPTNLLDSQGKELDVRDFVDSEFASNRNNRRSRTGLLTHVNLSPIIWHTKQQSTIETSVFGVEFVALKSCIDALKGIDIN